MGSPAIASCPDKPKAPSIMPELTEVIDTKPEEASNDNDSGTDSDGDDDSIPELEETAGDAAGDPAAAGAVGTGGDEASKAVARKRRGRSCLSLASSRWQESLE